MKLSVSNLAWPASLRSEALRILDGDGITAIEVAPTMEWPDWQVRPEQAVSFRDDLAKRHFAISSLQSILFNKPNAQLFGPEAAQHELQRHVEFCSALAGQLGAGPLVFGAPKNRLRGERSENEASVTAVDAFRRLAPALAIHGSCLCLEANPTDYGCDFMTEASHAAKIVRAVDHPGIGLHLDTACMHLAGDRAGQLIRDNADILRHVHVSEPFLGDFGTPSVDHAEVASGLREIGYTGWVVLEMRATERPLESLREAARFLSTVYGGGA